MAIPVAHEFFQRLYDLFPCLVASPIALPDIGGRPMLIY